MNAESPTARLQIEDQPRPPVYRNVVYIRNRDALGQLSWTGMREGSPNSTIIRPKPVVHAGAVYEKPYFFAVAPGFKDLRRPEPKQVNHLAGGDFFGQP